jgi:hypothetical protein
MRVTYLKSPPANSKAKSAGAVTWGHFRWVIWVAVAVAAFFAAPRPALKWQYEFSSSRGYDPYAERIYYRCDYISPLGNFTVRPTDGKCDWIKWLWRKPS